jgi:hypothetical protein
VKLVLERRIERDSGTFGVLTGPGLLLFTCELLWHDNALGESRVPPGLYRLEAHHTERFPDCWALIGPGVSHFPAPGAARSAVLIHAANRPEELRGCIAPGRMLGQIDGRLAVLRSRDALGDLRASLQRGRPHELVIVERLPGPVPTSEGVASGERPETP